MMNEQVAPALRHLMAKQFGQGIVGGGFTQLNYANKQWTLKHQGDAYPLVRQDDGTPLSFVDLVILEENPAVSKVLYADWGADGNSGQPICASANGVAPDPGVQDPQSKLCATCQHNFWQTLPTGRRGKTCQDHKRLAILLLPGMTKHLFNGKAMMEPVYLKIPPASLIPYRKYVEGLTATGIPAPAVVTRITWAPPPVQFQMVFKNVKFLSQQEAGRIVELIEGSDVKRLTGTMAAPEPEVQEDLPMDTGLMEALDPVVPPPKPMPQRKRDFIDVKAAAPRQQQADNMVILPPARSAKPKVASKAAPVVKASVQEAIGDFEESGPALDAALDASLNVNDANVDAAMADMAAEMDAIK